MSESVAVRIGHMEPRQEIYELYKLVAAMQIDLNNIAVFLANHQHSALNAVPSTSVPALSGTAWLASSQPTPSAAAPVLNAQP